MEIMALLVAFLTAVVVSGAIVYAFSAPMDAVVGRVVQGELASAWCKYAKFALFAAAFGGGLRIHELEAVSAGPVGQKRALMEVFKTTLGSITSASWTLLAIFGGALVVYGAVQAYNQLRHSERSENERRHPIGRM